MLNTLEADSVRKSFGNKQVLTDIYLKCQTGDITGLFGRNGAGKTTLLKIIFGVQDAPSKHVLINGEINDTPYRTGDIAFLFQDNFLLKNMTPARIMDLFGERLMADNIANDPIVSKILNTKVKYLSGGESRYLEVRIVLNLKAKFIFLDEPFNGISPVHAEIIREEILKQSVNKGIILTDHCYRDVLDVSNRYIVLYDGGLKTLKSKKDLEHWGYLPEE